MLPNRKVGLYMITSALAIVHRIRLLTRLFDAELSHRIIPFLPSLVHVLNAIENSPFEGGSLKGIDELPRRNAKQIQQSAPDNEEYCFRVVIKVPAFKCHAIADVVILVNIGVPSISMILFKPFKIRNDKGTVWVKLIQHLLRKNSCGDGVGMGKVPHCPFTGLLFGDTLTNNRKTPFELLL